MLIKTLIFSIIVLQISCFQTSDSSSSQNNNKISEEAKQTCPLISSETAILIAKGILCLDYDISDYEPLVETETELWKDKGEIWKVTFVSKREKTFGDPIVWIFKHNGERFTVKHAK